MPSASPLISNPKRAFTVFVISTLLCLYAVVYKFQSNLALAKPSPALTPVMTQGLQHSPDTDPKPAVMGIRVSTTDDSVAELPVRFDDPLTPKSLPNDPFAEAQWSFLSPLANRGSADHFNAQLHNANIHEVVVAVVDSGIVLNHEDLPTLPGYDFVSMPSIGNDGDGRDADPSDPGDWVSEKDHQLNRVSEKCQTSASRWHGTAVSGIIGASSNNQLGIAGGAPAVALLPVRITGKCGGHVNDLIDGIRWAAGLPVADTNTNQNPARIINLSVGFAGSCTENLQSAIDDAVNAGAILVTAATNSGADLDRTPYSPASCKNVLSIAASVRNGDLADYSAYGSSVFMLAPGGSAVDGIITSDNKGETLPLADSGYGTHYGTSLAAAHVSAALASMLSIEPKLTNHELLDFLAKSAIALTESECAPQHCGNGRLNVQRAVQMLLDIAVDEAPPESGQALAEEEPAIGLADPVTLTVLMWLAACLLCATGSRRPPRSPHP